VSELQADEQVSLTPEEERKVRGAHAVWQATLAAAREPRTREQLHKYIKGLCGFHIPRVAPTEGQQAPMDFIADAFFGEFDRALVLASRGSGKTLGVAILNHLISKFRPGTHTVHFGAIGRQASWGFGYVRDMVSTPWFVGDLVKATGGTIQWKNGSWLIHASGYTDTGVTAIRGNRLTQDEIDLWDMSIFETSQMMVQGTEQNPAQRIYTSTQYTAYGLMSQLLREAPRRGYHVFKWDVWAQIQRCPTCRGKDCPLFIWVNPRSGDVEPLCRGRALLSDGFVPWKAAVDEYLSTDPAVYQVQMLLEEPEREYLILPTFDEKHHVDTAPREAFAPETPRVCGVDWGFDHPLVFTVFAELPDGQVCGIHEHGERFASPSREIDIANELQAQYGTTIAPGHDELLFYCGADRPEAIANLVEHGFSAMACPQRSREARHRATRKLLRRDPQSGQARLKLDRERMPVTIWQFSTVHRDPKTGKEVAEANDYFDASEHALYVIEATGTGGAFVR